MTQNCASIQKLRELVQNACRENPHLTSGLEKAAFLVMLRNIESSGRDRFRIGSEDSLRFYHIVNGHCDCHDYVRHGSGHPCKHRLALSLRMNIVPELSSDFPPNSEFAEIITKI